MAPHSQAFQEILVKTDMMVVFQTCITAFWTRSREAPTLVLILQHP